MPWLQPAGGSGQDGCLRAGARVHLQHRRGHMVAYRPLAQPQRMGDVGDRAAALDLAQNVGLAVGQGRRTRRQGLERQALINRAAPAATVRTPSAKASTGASFTMKPVAPASSARWR